MTINLRSENGKHIVTYKGKEIAFNTLKVALLFIKLKAEGKNEKN